MSLLDERPYTSASAVAASSAQSASPLPPLPVRRTFSVIPAVRESAPLLLGLTGPSGSGKTFSALRLATGIARVIPGGIVLIDTENRRAKHYASEFKFSHIDFSPPYGSLDYLDALNTAAATKPAVIVVDSMSHEHDGEGGMLDSVTAELDRIAGADPVQQQKLSAAAWRKPKTARRALLSGLLRLEVHIILCMRAQERTRAPREQVDAVEMGLTPVAAPEFLFELTCCALLKAGAQGMPTWSSALPGEHAAIKLPRQFESVFRKADPLSERHGEALALWSLGPQIPQSRRRKRHAMPASQGTGGTDA